jgi:hypothetical protein
MELTADDLHASAWHDRCPRCPRCGFHRHAGPCVGLPAEAEDVYDLDYPSPEYYRELAQND